MPANSLKSRTKGYLFGILGVLILSPETLLIRLVDTSPWTFLTWRGGFDDRNDLGVESLIS